MSETLNLPRFATKLNAKSHLKIVDNCSKFSLSEVYKILMQKRIRVVRKLVRKTILEEYAVTSKVELTTYSNTSVSVVPV